MIDTTRDDTTRFDPKGTDPLSFHHYGWLWQRRRLWYGGGCRWDLLCND